MSMESKAVAPRLATCFFDEEGKRKVLTVWGESYEVTPELERQYKEGGHLMVIPPSPYGTFSIRQSDPEAK